MNQSQSPKWMSHGEAGLAAFLSATAFLCLIAAGKALDTAFAFHATLGAAASLWAVFAIFNRYFDRPYALPPREINGRPRVRINTIGRLGRSHTRMGVWVGHAHHLLGDAVGLHLVRVVGFADH